MEDGTEVNIMETVDYGDNDTRIMLDDKSVQGNESFADHGFTTQEFDDDELVDVEEENMDDFEEFDDFDSDDYSDEN